MIESMIDGRSIRRSLSRNRGPTLHHLHIVKFTMWKSTWRRGALNMPSSRWFALNFTFDVVHRSHNSFMMLENSESVHLNFDEVTSKSSVAVTAVTYWWQCYPPSICVTQRLLLKRRKSFRKVSTKFHWLAKTKAGLIISTFIVVLEKVLLTFENLILFRAHFRLVGSFDSSKVVDRFVDPQEEAARTRGNFDVKSELFSVHRMNFKLWRLDERKLLTNDVINVLTWNF